LRYAIYFNILWKLNQFFIGDIFFLISCKLSEKYYRFAFKDREISKIPEHAAGVPAGTQRGASCGRDSYQIRFSFL